MGEGISEGNNHLFVSHPTLQSRFCPRLVVRDSDTEHGPGDQRQFMGGNEHKSSFMEPAMEEVTEEVRSGRAARSSLGSSLGSSRRRLEAGEG